jgi:Yip1 domain
MSFQDWRDLAITSVKQPASAARTLMEMGFGTGILWNALVLVAIGNTLLYAISHTAMPGPSPLPDVFSVPLVYFTIVAGGLALTALSIFWIGRRMGGKGSLADVLVLVVWLQTLRLVVQVAVLVLVLVAPLFSVLLVFAAALIGVYILVHFVDQAHRFKSTGRAAVVLIASLLAIVFGLSFLLSLVGGFAGGSMPNV